MTSIVQARVLWNQLPPGLRRFWENFFLRYRGYCDTSFEYYGLQFHAKHPFDLFYCHLAYCETYFPGTDPTLPHWIDAFWYLHPDPTLQVGFEVWAEQFDQWLTVPDFLGQPPRQALKIPRHTRIGVSRHRRNL